MIKVKIISMARKPERDQEAKTRLGFLPKQKELTNTNTEQYDSVRCDIRVGSKTKEILEEISYGKRKRKTFCQMMKLGKKNHPHS